MAEGKSGRFVKDDLVLPSVDDPNADDPDNIITIVKNDDGSVMLWIESDDGEASFTISLADRSKLIDYLLPDTERGLR